MKIFLIAILFLLIGTLEAQTETAIFLIQQAKENNSEVLDLSNMGLTQVPSEIGELTQLKELILRNNDLTSLPPELSTLTNLEVLDLSFNDFPQFSFFILQLENLRIVDLEGNQITSIPPLISNLNQLEELNLARNELITLPSSIGELSRLKHFYLSSNQLTAIPDDIGNLTLLEQFDLSFNELATIPVEINQLENLQWLSLTNNNLKVFPEGIISELPNLQRLDLDDRVEVSARDAVIHALNSFVPDEETVTEDEIIEPRVSNEVAVEQTETDAPLGWSQFLGILSLGAGAFLFLRALKNLRKQATYR